MSAILAWHFTGPTLRDGRPVPPDGEWLVHDGPVVPCESGLHGSERIRDALEYAPGDTVCRVVLAGECAPHDGDKHAASKRCILWRIDGAEVLSAFARRCALDVAHFWGIPEVVRRYLETGDETTRPAAYAAAGAARAAAYAAAGAAGAAGAATWAAAWAAGAARAAARAAAGAAGDAAGAARDAEGAARAARDARAAQNTTLTAMVHAATGNPDDEALMRAALAKLEGR